MISLLLRQKLWSRRKYQAFLYESENQECKQANTTKKAHKFYYISLKPWKGQKNNEKIKMINLCSVTYVLSDIMAILGANE